MKSVLPEISVLTENLNVAEWLRVEYDKTRDMDRDNQRLRDAAALGMLARMWVSQFEEDRKTIRMWLETGRGTLSCRVSDWAKSSSLPLHAEKIEAAAMKLIPAHRARLEKTVDIGTSSWLIQANRMTGPAKMRAGLLSALGVETAITSEICLARDHLENIKVALFLLGAKEASNRLHAELGKLDEIYRANRKTWRAIFDTTLENLSDDEQVRARLDGMLDAADGSEWWVPHIISKNDYYAFAARESFPDGVSEEMMDAMRHRSIHLVSNHADDDDEWIVTMDEARRMAEDGDALLIAPADFSVMDTHPLMPITESSVSWSIQRWTGSDFEFLTRS
jgi:hypothetical protein